MAFVIMSCIPVFRVVIGSRNCGLSQQSPLMMIVPRFKLMTLALIPLVGL